MAKELSYFMDRFPQAPLELSAGRTYGVGRGGGNELFLPDVQASRRHAEISWDGEAFVIRDLGSANGTFVNDEPVTERRLASGDEIRVGSHVLTFRVEESGRAAKEFKRQAKELQTWQTVTDKRSGEGGLSGALEEVDLFQVLQVLEGGRKTGRLLVTAVGVSASLYFKDGRVVAARFESKPDGRKIEDREAVYATVGLAEGVFEFLAEEVDFEPRIAESTQALLLEAMRRLDETRRTRLSAEETQRA
jgi:pSer/pThr/pTyr-binding forkhead associated (FHA) protein